ncbi:hypothetical protein HHK36_000890 [Tetracentron sinense]|uniref:Uncharacterized protein n=1 Tax=Tetracentron sinense TaxID=13715 RepID=A0A835DQF8_TETSI|nr:hypothetical protein HHK36_000890 [Tetracentron sinense]
MLLQRRSRSSSKPKTQLFNLYSLSYSLWTPRRSDPPRAGREAPPKHPSQQIRRGCDLVNRVQASDEELMTGLRALSAVEIDGYWRIGATPGERWKGKDRDVEEEGAHAA